VVQAIMSAIDDYAERETGNRDPRRCDQSCATLIEINGARGAFVNRSRCPSLICSQHELFQEFTMLRDVILFQG
jgi:hypothetical protein